MGRRADSHRTLPHVVWIGGSPCAGKSTIADALAREHGFALYRCDAALDAHVRRTDPSDYPLLHRLTSAPWDELWSRPVATQIREELAFYREEFPLVVEDLRGYHAGNPVIAEGTALLPGLITPFLTSARRGIWLVPGAAFQREHYARRPWIRAILDQCADPAAAFDNWMGRDSGFADAVARSADAHRLPVLRVDGARAIEDSVAFVARALGLRQ